MKLPEHLALSFLIAQFGVQQQYGTAGTLLLLVSGCLPDVDGLSILGGWQIHRTCYGVIAHGLPVTLAGPFLLGLFGAEVCGLGEFLPLWIWLQIALLAHLVTDITFSRWPLQLLWPISTRTWSVGLVERNDLAPAFILSAAAATALIRPSIAPIAARTGISALLLYAAWRGVRPSSPKVVQTESMPRIWYGCDLVAWLRLLADNRFALDRSHWYIAGVITCLSLVNSALRIGKIACYDWRFRNAPLPEAPIFIIGHWRTGTTLLHELLALDDRHAVPTTYQCLAPNHFLLTQNWMPRLLWFLMPSRRPMDNMKSGWGRPQEDEFALCILGLPSPYRNIAFPNRMIENDVALDLERLSPQALATWKKTFLYWLRQVAFQHGGQRLVLKSPPHTCRIKVLLELFPHARFVHIVRDPYDVFPSTVNLWKAFYHAHALQQPTLVDLEEQVFRTFLHFNKRLDGVRHLVAPSRFHELRYEDLVRDPEGKMRELYEKLQLQGFDDLAPRLEIFLAQSSNYRTNRYETSPAMRNEITLRWGNIIRRYGYAEKS